MDSIVKSYIQETNRFMKAYNDEFINIQNTLQIAEEKQKYYFFKIQEINIMKAICGLAGKNEEDCIELDNQIRMNKKKLKIYEQIIFRCDKEFEDCRNRREQDFKELFEINQEQSLMVIKKKNFFIKIINNFKNLFNGYEKFSKLVLQKYAIRINNMKTETIDMYINNVKKNMIKFSNEVDGMLEEV